MLTRQAVSVSPDSTATLATAFLARSSSDA